MAIAELAIGRILGFSIPELRDRARPLPVRPVAPVKLKRHRKTKPDQLWPAITLAGRTASGIVKSLRTIPSFTGAKAAESVRTEILAHFAGVSLAAIVDYAWSQGIAIIHMKHFPAGKKPTGIAMYVGETPVVILCSAYDSPAWLAFHATHELGHVFRGHVLPGQQPLADAELDGLDNEPEEVEADEFACRVLSGQGRPAPMAPKYGLTAQKLADQVTFNASLQKADPGFMALAYGLAAGRMPVAQAALKALKLDHGGQAIIDAALRRHLTDELSETAEQFVALATSG